MLTGIYICCKSLCHYFVAMVQSSTRHTEYCQSEVFRAKCLHNQVIMMTHAKYGRMRIGRCVVADLGNKTVCVNKNEITNMIKGVI